MILGAEGIVSAEIKRLKLRKYAERCTERHQSLLSQGITESIIYLVFSFLLFFKVVKQLNSTVHSFPPAHSTLQSIQ